MNDSATGRELNTNTLTICITIYKVPLNRNTHRTRFCIDHLTKNIVTRGLKEPDPVIPLGAVAQYLLIQSLWWLYRT